MKPTLLLGAEYVYSFRTMESYDKVYSLGAEEYIFRDRKRNATDDFDMSQPAIFFGAGISIDLFGYPTSIDLRYKSTFNKSGIPNGSSERFKMLSVNVGVTLFNLSLISQ